MTELQTGPTKTDLHEYLSSIATQPMPERINPEDIVAGRTGRQFPRLLAVTTLAAAAGIAIVGVAVHGVLGSGSSKTGPASVSATPTAAATGISPNNCTAAASPGQLRDVTSFGNVNVGLPGQTSANGTGEITWQSPAGSGPALTVSFPGSGNGIPPEGSASAAANNARSQALQKGDVGVSAIDSCSVDGQESYFFSGTQLHGGEFYDFFVTDPTGTVEIDAVSSAAITGQNLQDLKVILGSIQINMPPTKVPFGTASATFSGALSGKMTSIGSMPADELGSTDGYPTPPQVCHPSGDFAAWTGSLSGQSGRVELNVSGKPGMLNGSAGNGPFSLQQNSGQLGFAVTVTAGNAEWNSQSGTVSLRTSHNDRGGSFTAHLVPAAQGPSGSTNTATGTVDITGSFSCQ